MESRTIKIESSINKDITIKVIPGHFATSHSHVNYFVDMTSIKHRHNMAHDAAKQMALQYKDTTPIDTIVCMDGCEIIGAYLAEELDKLGLMGKSTSNSIKIITPEFNSNGQLIFRDNVQPMVWGKNVLLLIASATTGKTINRSLECIKYYGGIVVGISAIFSAIESLKDIPIRMLFTINDIKDYSTYSLSDCPYCKDKRKIDAIINSYGYSKI